MAPKADAKKGKKEESESGSYESEEYETESEESSEKKPAAKKEEPKKTAAKKEEAKPAAKPAAAAKKESSDDEDESEEYEYETETESSEKKPATKATATVTTGAKKGDGKAAAVTATAKVTTTATAAAKKKDESEDDDESEEYEYESEYESDSDDKKKAAAAKGGDTKAAAAASKPADTKAVAVATTTTKAADTKPAAKAPAATTATTTTTTTTTVVAAREVVAVKPRGVVEDPAHPWQPRKFVAEFLGTMIFCFVVYMSRMNQAPYGVYYGWPLGGMVSQALVQAFALIAVMAAFGGVSGGHFNPAVTLFMMLTRQTHVAIGLIYCIVQFAGAILGGALAWGLTSPLIINHMPNGQGTGYSAPITCTVFPISVAQANGTAPGGGYMNTINSNSGFSAGVNEWSCWPQAFGAEIMGSAIFIFLYGMLWVSGHGGMQHVSLGLALGMLVFAYEDISNAFFNPARALGSAAFAGVYQWTNFWVWIIGPICGAVIATLFWGLLYQRAWDRSIGSSVYSRGDHM